QGIGARVAEVLRGDGFEVVGFDLAETPGGVVVGTLRDYRRRGVASALIAHALRAAADQGYDRASVSVDSSSPSGASGIFEKAGFTPTMRFVRWALEA
ncbi:GNAT family N-acetyltransferase, partial [Actinosynnema sp. NPDC023658]|uniref:GNAT family N-acetyltransferase n=1 Tax=Actinosynnema sp. NPDC023658 TaxID=3155465 RepID=UPI0033F3E2E1